MNIYNQFPELKTLLDSFVDYFSTSLQTRSIIIFGGISLGDFSSKYSDIDIIVTLDNGLSEEEIDLIEGILSKLKKQNKEFTDLLYVYFIPIRMIENPNQLFRENQGLEVHRGKNDTIEKYPFSVTDTYTIREHGKILFGKQDIKKFPKPAYDCFYEKFKQDLFNIEKFTTKYPFQPNESQNQKRAVNWILYFPRLLYSLKEKDVINKTKGAYWFFKEYTSDLGKFVIEVASCRKKNVSIDNVENVVENSVKLLLFSLEKAFEIRGIQTPHLSELLEIKDNTTNFSKMFNELKKLL